MAFIIKNENCMDLMARYPDNYFDLAIVDPPYGLKENAHRENNRSKLAKSKKYHTALWSQGKPDQAYFNELFRVSKNQIIWGANHFIESFSKDSTSWIVWDKQNGDNNFADAELAWTSHKSAVRIFRFRWQGMLQGNMKNKENRIHPTQKPVALYKWLLDKYAQPGDKILDTHLGSGSIALACLDYGHFLTACEIEEVHFNDAMDRINTYMSQPKIAGLSAKKEKVEVDQKKLNL